MNFLDFLKQTDDKRRRAKRLAINLLYFLTPVVILAASFTNDRIIAECEEIHEECQDRIRALQNSGERTDTRELETLREENRRLRQALATQPDVPLPPPDDDGEALSGQIAELERELARCEATKKQLEEELRRQAPRSQPGNGAALDQCESDKEDLRGQRDDCEKRMGSLQEEIDRLNKALEECESRRRRTPSSPASEEILGGSTFISVKEIPRNQGNLVQSIPKGEAFKLMVNKQVVAYFIGD
jgi:chaperonin cofactor prefoldin